MSSAAARDLAYRCDCGQLYVNIDGSALDLIDYGPKHTIDALYNSIQWILADYYRSMKLIL